MSVKTLTHALARKTLFWDIESPLPASLAHSYNLGTTNKSQIHVSDSYEKLSQSHASLKILLEPELQVHKPLDNLYIVTSQEEVLTVLEYNNLI